MPNFNLNCAMHYIYCKRQKLTEHRWRPCFCISCLSAMWAAALRALGDLDSFSWLEYRHYVILFFLSCSQTLLTGAIGSFRVFALVCRPPIRQAAQPSGLHWRNWHIALPKPCIWIFTTAVMGCISCSEGVQALDSGFYSIQWLTWR